MGLRFNSADTREVMHKVNSHFSDNLAYWKGIVGQFAPGVDLWALARAANPPIDAAGAAGKANWKVWLQQVLPGAPSPVLDDGTGNGRAYNPVVPFSTPYRVPGSGDPSNVRDELARLFNQALTDANCIEIVMVIQPSATVYIAQAETLLYPGGANPDYSLAITICTTPVSNPQK
jgi:hypothetical protein